MAGAALIADAAALEVADGGRAGVDGLRDVSIGFAAADTNDHVFVLRLSLNTHMMPCPFPDVKMQARTSL